MSTSSEHHLATLALHAGQVPDPVTGSRAVPIHQAVVAKEARGIYYGRLSEMTDTDFQVLEEESGTAF